MKKVLLLAGIMAIGLYASRGAASAQTVSFDLMPNTVSTDAEGTWHVVATEVQTATGATWTVRVTPNSGTPTETSGQPNAVLHSIHFVVTPQGGANLTGTNGVGSSFGDGAKSPWMDTGNLTWIWSVGEPFHLGTNPATDYFIGTVDVAQYITYGSVGMSVQDGTTFTRPPQWSGSSELTPEPGSLALLLPGLLPLGLLLRRRRA